MPAVRTVGQTELRDTLRAFYGSYITDLEPGNIKYAVVLDCRVRNITKGWLRSIREQIAEVSISEVSLETLFIYNADEPQDSFSSVVLVIKCSRAGFYTLRKDAASRLGGVVRELYKEEKWLVSVLASLDSTGIQVWQRSGNDWIPAAIPTSRHIGYPLPRMRLPDLGAAIERWQGMITGAKQFVAGITRGLVEYVSNTFSFLGNAISALGSFLVEKITQCLLWGTRIYQKKPKAFLLSTSCVVIVALVTYLAFNRKKIPDGDVYVGPSSVLAQPTETGQKFLDSISVACDWHPKDENISFRLRSAVPPVSSTQVLRYRISVYSRFNRNVSVFTKVGYFSFNHLEAKFTEKGFRPITYYMIEVNGEPVEITTNSFFSARPDRDIVVSQSNIRISSQQLKLGSGTRYINANKKKLSLHLGEMRRGDYTISLNLADGSGNSVKGIDAEQKNGFFSYP